MSRLSRLSIVVLGLLLAGPALALRCQSKLVSEGDPQAKVLRFCGEPTSVQQRVIYRSGIARSSGRGDWLRHGNAEIGVYRDELLVHQRSVVEVLVDEWIYNFGPRKLMRRIRFENGLVTAVEPLGYGYLED
jgi:hypothetical protein